LNRLVTPKLSILIPTRNRAEYVSHTVASALAIPSNEIEVVVSENYSDDKTLEIVRGFEDTRLRVIRPPRPLPMHENWEFLLSEASGEWITFLGDDDAILPYALEELNRLSRAFPWCEALYSARAYYFWPSSINPKGVLRFPFLNDVQLNDSKDTFLALLNAQLNYLYAPQIYSGGFQRRSLVNRIRRAGGFYFKSVIPDAASAVSALSFTTNFVRLGVPLCIVGTSPSQDVRESLSSKSRVDYFYDRLGASDLQLHVVYPLSPGQLAGAEAHFCLLEAVHSSIPFCRTDLLDATHLERALLRTFSVLSNQGRGSTIEKLFQYFGKQPPEASAVNEYLYLFPEIIPDPLPSSVMYTTDGFAGEISNISEAIALVENIYRQVGTRTVSH
jgi:glycosyltransferase involved in cell wall biosynthesis